MDPIQRWSPQQARLHPFITGEKWTKPWTVSAPISSVRTLADVFVQPTGNGQATIAPATAATPSNATDPKRPYGGLVSSQPKSTGAYRDAAAYNQQLAQQQAYTAQQQAAAQAAQNVYRNPYVQQQAAQPPPTQTVTSTYTNQQESPAANYISSSHPHPRLTHQSSHGHLSISTGNSQYPGASGFTVPSQHPNPAAPSNTYQSGGTRARSNTINHMMDNVPPALARLQHMNQDVIGGRKALTPVLKRDDAIREWERRQSGKAAAAQPYPQLEYLQQQAEMAAAQGLVNWTYSNPPQGSNRYQAPSSNLSHSYTNMVVDEDRREAVMSNVRQAARTDPNNSVVYASSTNIIPSPPQTYASNSTTTGNRYANTYAQQTPTSPFDLDRRPDMGQLYVPMQPDQYGPYNPANSQSGSQPGPARQVAAPAQVVPPSFYGAGVVPAGQQQRNPFSQPDGLPQMSTKESRRKSGMDLWSS